MTDLSLTLLSGASAMIAMTIMCLAALRGWSQWIALKRHEMDRPVTATDHDSGPDIANAASRIDIADLRERVRKLEAIAAGVDL
jgi:hypothetical protein